MGFPYKTFRGALAAKTRIRIIHVFLQFLADDKMIFLMDLLWKSSILSKVVFFYGTTALVICSKPGSLLLEVLFASLRPRGLIICICNPPLDLFTSPYYLSRFSM